MDIAHRLFAILLGSMRSTPSISLGGGDANDFGSNSDIFPYLLSVTFCYFNKVYIVVPLGTPTFVCYFFIPYFGIFYIIYNLSNNCPMYLYIALHISPVHHSGFLFNSFFHQGIWSSRTPWQSYIKKYLEHSEDMWRHLT